MSNEELIAEAREAQSVAFNDNEVGYALIIRALADALEAQSALLVADSREALAFVFYERMGGDTELGAPFMPDDYNRMKAEGLVDAAIASGVVSLAADRDRAKWQEGHRYGLLDARQGVTTVNPYRESEARND